MSVEGCLECGHHELSNKLDPDILYGKTFSYVSSSSPGLRDYFGWAVRSISDTHCLPKTKLNWLDIGSNDGSLLDIVYNSGIHATYGIEPSEEQYLISISKDKHQISKGYACEETFQTFGKQNFDVITIFNTLSMY